jgi:polyisoprenoid-binding protein YceI
MMVSTVRGRFMQYRGAVRLDTTDFTRSSFEAEIDVASIDTGNAMRDEHLRASDLFDVARYPRMTFKATRIREERKGFYTVFGDLTIRGVTRPIVLNVTFRGTSKNHRGVAVAGVSATGAIDRRDFGLTYNFPLETGGVAISEKVMLEIDAELALDARHGVPETRAAGVGPIGQEL